MWWWILIWALLFIGAAVVLGLLGWNIARRGIALGRQLGESADLVSAALEPVTQPYQPELSVLVDPSSLPDAPNRSSGTPGRRRA